jgi:protein arginine N-methyltransferase 1
MYDLIDYGGMIAFASRTSAYARALEARISPGAVVLDIGAGPGIMSLLACRAGAGKVYAVESEDVIQVAVQRQRIMGFRIGSNLFRRCRPRSIFPRRST